MTCRTLFSTLALAAVAHANVLAQDAPVDSLGLARQYTAWLYEGRADSLLAHSTPEKRIEMGPAGQYDRLSDMIAEHAGVELEVSEETWKLRNGACQYWRVAQFSEMDEPLLIRWVLDAEGQITGLGAGPYSQAPPVESETCGAPSE